ncbi:EF-hand domain-containing protein [Nonomuraea sp. NPDC046570]|uniref:EF-hand domain-containing protein n=1 Tax=Nonomuraea sp. NPDC046570 TaxID=3155255 RepID=UPI0034022926
MSTEVKERKLARHFELLDFDGDGYIERSDIRSFAERICEAAGTTPNSNEGKKIMQQGDKLWKALQRSLDHDGDQQVSRNEFVDSAGSDPVMKEAIQLGVAAFDVLDQDRDNKISRDEWTRMDQRLGVSMQDSRKGFDQLDKDSDGYVTKAEYTKGVEEFYRSQDPAAPGNWAFGSF